MTSNQRSLQKDQTQKRSQTLQTSGPILELLLEANVSEAANDQLSGGVFPWRAGLVAELDPLGNWTLRYQSLFFRLETYPASQGSCWSLLGNPAADLADIGEVVDCLGLSIAHCTKLHPVFSVCAPYSLMRMDDNGTECFMEDHPNYLQAFQELKTYEKRGHKQYYFIKSSEAPGSSGSIRR